METVLWKKKSCNENEAWTYWIVLFLFWIPRVQNVLHIDGISRETDGLWESPWPREWAHYRITGGGISGNSLRIPACRSKAISGIVHACRAMRRPACSRMQVRVHNTLNSARVEYFPPSGVVFGIECIPTEQSYVKQKMITIGIKLMLEKKIGWKVILLSIGTIQSLTFILQYGLFFVFFINV